MRVLVTWGSKRGGTEGIARIVGDTLRAQGMDVDLIAARDAIRVCGFDAVIVGGALYAGRWHRAARRFVARRQRDLRAVPVWFFSSGPLDDSSDRHAIPPTPQVQMLMERVGAIGHVTFGGRLSSDARGFPASAMAKKHAGDWRNEVRIRSWATEVARNLPGAHHGLAVDQPGGSPARLVAHGAMGWLLCAVVMWGLLQALNSTIALAVHAVAAPLIFAVVARHYFRQPGSWDALWTAAAFVAITVVLDLVVVAGAVQHSPAIFASVPGTWVPLLLIFVTTWMVGELRWIAAPTRQAKPKAA
jgi:menaquinone-dependent protoporphyrinogen oxidase